LLVKGTFFRWITLLGVELGGGDHTGRHRFAEEQDEPIGVLVNNGG
jgi:hypothetical protein